MNCPPVFQIEGTRYRAGRAVKGAFLCRVVYDGCIADEKGKQVERKAGMVRCMCNLSAAHSSEAVEDWRWREEVVLDRQMARMVAGVPCR